MFRRKPSPLALAWERHPGELEVVDSVTGHQLAAAVISQTDSRLSFFGLSKWGDAEAVMKDWSKRIVMRIDEAHGVGKK